MNSVLDQIFQKFNEKKETASWAISKELLKLYEDSNEIPDIKTLANQCFVSAAMITKFSKELGFTGYKELSMKIKIEKSDRKHKNVIENNKINSSIGFNNVKINCINVIHEFDFSENRINDFINSINNSEKIHIFSSHAFIDQAKKCTSYFCFNNIVLFFLKQRCIL